MPEQRKQGQPTPLRLSYWCREANEPRRNLLFKLSFFYYKPHTLYCALMLRLAIMVVEVSSWLEDDGMIPLEWSVKAVVLGVALSFLVGPFSSSLF